MSERPQLELNLDEPEFRRWYWTMDELQPFARSIGVRATGPKAELVDRIAATLGGRGSLDPVPAPGKHHDENARIVLPLHRETAIPVGQRSTQDLRAFFEAEVGPTFRFNGHMRAFLAAGGTTLGDAVDHWHQTVGTPLPAQPKSLEYNRFTSAWHAAHPTGSSAACRAAWQAHRALPKDERPPIG